MGMPKPLPCAHGVLPKSACGQCRADYMRAWNRKNLEKARANSKASRERHQERRRAEKQEHYRKNADVYKARAVKWKAANRSKVLDGSRRYTRELREQQPRRLSCRNLNARASERGAVGKVTVEEYDAVVRASGGYCFWCDGQLTVWCEFDHPMPLKLKGEHSVKNLVLACRPCNKHKDCRHPADFNRNRWERFQRECST